MSGSRKKLGGILEGGLSAERTIGIGTNLALVVARIHSRNQTHGRLNPDTVRVGDDDTIELATDGDDLDSTLAVLEELAGHRDPERNALMQLAYESPEQHRGQPPTPLSDIYSVGCILYAMTTGRAAFRGETREAIIADVALATYEDVLELSPQTPRPLARVIHRCLEPRPEDRFSSLEKLADVLSAILNPKAKHRTTMKTGVVSSRLVDEPEAFDDLPGDLPPATSEAIAPSSPPPPPLTNPRERVEPVQRAVTRLRYAVAGLTAVALAAIVLAVYLGTRTQEASRVSQSNADPNTLLVVPMEVRGQNVDSDFLGRAFAESVAINLALGGTLKVLPVPTDHELVSAGSLERAELAQRTGAGKLVTGSLTRADGRLSASLSLVDTVENRIVWGATERAGISDYTQLAVALVRRLGEHLGSEFPQMYDYITNLTGGPGMAASPTTAAVIAALRDGNISGAVTKTEALIAAFPEEPDARALRAHALLLNWDASPSSQNMGKLERALEELRRIDPRSPYETFYRGYISQERGDRRDAVLSYSAVLERDDLSPRARAWVLKYRANVEQQLENNTAALDDLEEALRIDPANAWTLGLLSETLRNMGRLEDALVRGRQAVNLAPGFWRNQQSVGLAYSQLERYAEAHEPFEKACALSEAQVPCALQAINLFRLNEKSAAREVALAAEELTPRPWGLYNLACYYALSGEREKSIEFLEGAAELGLVDGKVSSDSDLASLKGDPRFEAIVARFSKEE